MCGPLIVIGGRKQNPQETWPSRGRVSARAWPLHNSYFRTTSYLSRPLARNLRRLGRHVLFTCLLLPPAKPTVYTTVKDKSYKQNFTQKVKVEGSVQTPQAAFRTNAFHEAPILPKSQAESDPYLNHPHLG